MYNDQLVYKVVIWAFLNYFMNREGRFKLTDELKLNSDTSIGPTNHTNSPPFWWW